VLIDSNRVIIFLLAERAQCTFCVQEENPETKMRGRELPGGSVVVVVDSGCAVVAGSVSSDGEKETREMLQCLSSSLSIFCSLLFCPSFLWLYVFFCFVLAAAVLVVAHGAGGGGKLWRAEGGR
jgi:hypothetical protein